MNGVTMNRGREAGGRKMDGGWQEIKHSGLNTLGFIKKATR